MGSARLPDYHRMGQYRDTGTGVRDTVKRKYAECVMRRQLHIVDMQDNVVMCTRSEFLVPPAEIRSIGQTTETISYCKDCVTKLLNRVL
jgi:hypothetical protein